MDFANAATERAQPCGQRRMSAEPAGRCERFPRSPSPGRAAAACVPGRRYLIDDAFCSAAIVSSTVSRTVVWTELSARPHRSRARSRPSTRCPEPPTDYSRHARQRRTRSRATCRQPLRCTASLLAVRDLPSAHVSAVDRRSAVTLPSVSNGSMTARPRLQAQGSTVHANAQRSRLHHRNLNVCGRNRRGAGAEIARPAGTQATVHAGEAWRRTNASFRPT